MIGGIKYKYSLHEYNIDESTPVNNTVDPIFKGD